MAGEGDGVAHWVWFGSVLLKGGGGDGWMGLGGVGCVGGREGRNEGRVCGEVLVLDVYA